MRLPVRTPLVIVAAMSKNRVIARCGRIPWSVPSDVMLARRLTIHKPVIIGRTTFDVIGKPLPDRRNIVLSRNPDFRAPGVVVTGSFSEALDAGQQAAGEMGADEIVVFGGQSVYDLAIGHSQKIYLSVIDVRVEGGDRFFPDVSTDDWREVSRERFPAADRDERPFDLVVFERRGGVS